MDSPCEGFQNIDSSIAGLRALDQKDVQIIDETRKDEIKRCENFKSKKAVSYNQTTASEHPYCETIKEEGGSGIESYSEKHNNNIIR